MLYVFHGNPVEARDKAEKLAADLLKRKPDASVLRLSGENFEPERLAEYCFGQGLFAEKLLVLANNLLSHAEHGEFILDRTDGFKESPNIFIFVENALAAKQLKTVEKNAEKVHYFPEKSEKKEFSIFALADALGLRDRKNLWVLLERARRSGAEDELIHGTLFWQVKSILLVQSAKDAAEAGMKEFPYKKARAYAKKYSRDELEQMMDTLVRMYHDARRGKGDFKVLLELFILGI